MVYGLLRVLTTWNYLSSRGIFPVTCSSEQKVVFRGIEILNNLHFNSLSVSMLYSFQVYFMKALYGFQWGVHASARFVSLCETNCDSKPLSLMMFEQLQTNYKNQWVKLLHQAKVSKPSVKSAW